MTLPEMKRGLHNLSKDFEALAKGYHIFKNSFNISEEDKETIKLLLYSERRCLYKLLVSLDKITIKESNE